MAGRGAGAGRHRASAGRAGDAPAPTGVPVEREDGATKGLYRLVIDGAEAARIGLVNRTYESQEALLAGVMAIAADIAAKSPVAIRGTKEMIRYMRDHRVDDGLEYIATWNAAMLQSEDLRLAMTAHMTKQKPEFAD